jgi:hypothetical protein
MENIYIPYPKSKKQSNNSQPKSEVVSFLLSFSAALEISETKMIGKRELLLN